MAMAIIRGTLSPYTPMSDASDAVGKDGDRDVDGNNTRNPLFLTRRLPIRLTLLEF